MRDVSPSEAGNKPTKLLLATNRRSSFTEPELI